MAAIAKQEQKKKVLLQPENHNKKYEGLFLGIDEGETKLPMFQRDFVWDKERSAKLIDSILKGFPIGTFIFWRTNEELRSYRNVGNHKLPQSTAGEYVEYILDGQQRITSLYAIRKGIRITRDGKEVDYKDIFIDLDGDPVEDEELVVVEPKEGGAYISVHRVLTDSFTSIMKDFPDYIKVIEEYKTKLTTYDFSAITIKNYPIEIACEVFSRINTGGQELTPFEIMVARTYDEKRKFDLMVEYLKLLNGEDENDDDCLRAAKFDTVPGPVILQCVGAVTGKAIRTKDLLRLKKGTFIDNWEPMKDSLFSSVDFIRHELRIPVSQILPYHGMLVPLTYFFHLNKNKKPSKQQRMLLEQWFYWVGITYRYSSGAEGKIADDLEKMERIKKNISPKYPNVELNISADDLAEWEFRAGDASCKTVLCLLAYNEPKSLDTNGIVNLDNSNLKIASSRNYHHFFPKAYQ